MIEVKNIKIDTQALEDYANKLGASIDRALAGLAAQVSGRAKDSAPVDTGALKNSIDFEKVDEGTYWVKDGVEYGIYQELGTSKMAAHPFLVPAMEQAAKDVASAVEKALPK